MVTAKEEYENELEIKKNDIDEQRAVWESSHRFLTDRFQQVEADHYIIVSENVFALVKMYTLCFPGMNNEIDTGKSKEYIIEFIFRKFLYHQYPTSESSEIIRNFIFLSIIVKSFRKGILPMFIQNVTTLMSLIMTLSDGISVARNIMILVMAQIQKQRIKKEQVESMTLICDTILEKVRESPGEDMKDEPQVEEDTFDILVRDDINNSVISFKGRHKLKQYLPNKPTKWGFKVFLLCDSFQGYVYKFNFFKGGTDYYPYNITMELVTGLEHLNIHLTVDNW